MGPGALDLSCHAGRRLGRSHGVDSGRTGNPLRDRRNYVVAVSREFARLTGTQEGSAMTAPAVPAGMADSRFNRFMVRFLKSPFGRLSGRVVLVRYVGRVSGITRQLPVNCERFEGSYLIRVGRPETKRWWRNFTVPSPVELVQGSRVIRGTGLVVLGTTGQGQRVAADYFATHHGAARRAGLPRLRRRELPTPEALQAAAATLVFVVVTPAG
jgi:hypothetical protein